ncbi:MAG TPA: CPBP family intramembrane glutamic endopeptidase [Blastocatellia bacterium]|nr:CPBP family intramembrane glutamic endopeptidase [Blastocatellia bacterium]
MNNIFLDPQTKLLRTEWRVAIFIVISPYLLMVLELLLSAGREPATATAIGIDWLTIIAYVAQVVWVIAASWACLKFFEKMRLSSLGFAFFRGWWRETWLGFVIAALMMSAVVALQTIGGGTRLMLNPLFWKTVDGARSFDFIGLGMMAREIGLAFILLALAAAFEELLFRGYPFQTLLRGGVAPVIPILVLSIFFGAMHLGNPNSTTFSTVNTILAGIWLAVAYLKTRSLWFPTALHLGWNWMMGAFYGIPISGLKLIRYPVFLATNEAPLWLTGGSYGCEGGVAATLVLMVATLIIAKAKWLQVAPEMQAALNRRDTEREETIKLGLVE